MQWHLQCQEIQQVKIQAFGVVLMCLRQVSENNVRQIQKKKTPIVH